MIDSIHGASRSFGETYVFFKGHNVETVFNMISIYKSFGLAFLLKVDIESPSVDGERKNHLKW